MRKPILQFQDHKPVENIEELQKTGVNFMSLSSEYGSPDLILGEEFLTWLWYKSDIDPSFFKDHGGESFQVYLEKKVVVQGGNGDAKETASVSGSLSPLREARFGLRTGKKVSRAFLRLEKNDLCWQFSISANDFSFQSLRIPKIGEKDQNEDPDALILENVYLVEECLQVFDSIFETFISMRFSDNWQSEVEAVRSWMTELD